MVSVRTGFATLPPREDRDQIFEIHGMSWAQFEAMLAARGDKSVPRMAYANGTIELMNPSQRHEEKKSVLGCLIEAYAFEKGIYFVPWGSTTLTSHAAEKGAEPDESYALKKGAIVPDLVIEAVLTSGGIDKMKLYRQLGVREVWFWFETGLEAYALREGQYERIERSEVFEGLSIATLDAYAAQDDMFEAVQAFRASLRE